MGFLLSCFLEIFDHDRPYARVWQYDLLAGSKKRDCSFMFGSKNIVNYPYTGLVRRPCPLTGGVKKIYNVILRQKITASTKMVLITIFWFTSELKSRCSLFQALTKKNDFFAKLHHTFVEYFELHDFHLKMIAREREFGREIQSESDKVSERERNRE